MRAILNLISIALILWAGSVYAPDYIQIIDTSTLAVATLAIWATWLIVVVLLSVLALLGAMARSVFMLIAPIIFILFATPIALVIVNNTLAGFHIEGFWTYVALTICISIVTNIIYNSFKPATTTSIQNIDY